MGIDRLSFSFPITAHDESDVWDTDTRSGTTRRLAVSFGRREAQVYLGVAQLGTGAWWGKVECNPSRLRDPAGCSLLPLQELPLAAGAMWVAASRVMTPAVDIQNARVKRLDVARDFRGVSLPSVYVRGLAGIRRPYAKRLSVHADPARNSAETLTVGSGAGMVRLYDQHEAYASKGAEPGSVRWELEARSGWLERVGVERLGDLSVGAVESLARYRWEWSGMGSEVTGVAGVIDAVDRDVALGRMGDREANAFLGRLLRQSLGTAGPVSRATEFRDAAHARRLGVRPSSDLLDREVRVVGRLDYDSGREIAA